MIEYGLFTKFHSNRSCHKQYCKSSIVNISIIINSNCDWFLLDFLKNKKNEKKLNILERAIKDLIEEFRTLELSLSDQKKILNNYKYTLERLDQEISRLADSSEGDSNITNAIKMANQGKSVDEISQTTGMTKEEIEPIIKYHGRT